MRAAEIELGKSRMDEARRRATRFRELKDGLDRVRAYATGGPSGPAPLRPRQGVAAA